MKRLIFISILALMVLPSCQITQTPTATIVPTNTATHEPSTTPTPKLTESPTLTPSREPTAPQTLTPTPTQTPLPSPTPIPEGFYTHIQGGFSMIYPGGWMVDDEGDMFIRLVNPVASLEFLGFAWQIGDQPYSFEDSIDWLSGEWVAPLTVQNRNRVVLQDGTIAQRAVMSYEIQGEPALVHLVYVKKGANVYEFVCFGPSATFEPREKIITDMFKSIDLQSDQLYGVARSQTLVLEGYDPYPEDLDPAMGNAGADGYIGLIYSGMVRLSTQLQVEPDLAEAWSISPDGLVYTFTIRSGAAFESGRQITAQDVKYSWERAADPQTDSSTAATYLGDIVGVREKLNGQADEITGVQVFDDRTLVVELDSPKPYFLAKLTFPTSFVLDQENVEADPQGWVFAPNASGPFTLKEYVEGEALIFERNPAYHQPPAIGIVVYKLNQAGTSLSYYEAGEVDIIYISPTDAKSILETQSDPLQDQLLKTTSMCTDYIQFSNTRPPLDDVNVRRALALAIDKRRLNEQFFENQAVVAQSLLPPGMPGYSLDGAVVTHRPGAARRALAASSYADDMPPIVINALGYGDSDDPLLTALIDMWRRTLRIEVSVEYVDPRDSTRGLHQADGQIVVMGWCADYPDPENFLDILGHSESIFNYLEYSNPEVDQMLESARVEMNPERRIEDYIQVESLLLEDFAFVPLWHDVWFTLVNPRVQGYVEPPMGAAVIHLLSIEENTGND